MTEVFNTYLPLAIMLVGIFAFVVSVIIEVIKELPWMKRIPTDLVVILLALAVTLLAFFAYTSYAAIAVTWYLIVAAVIAGFFVAFIAMFGWEKLTALYSRFKK